VLAARDEVALSANVPAIEAAGGRALAVSTDVVDEASVTALFACTTAAFGPVDMLVNAAGAVASAPFEQMDVGHVGDRARHEPARYVPLLP
jgi:3-oxoacyl-[acyl-carrier protein] reductase